MGILSDVTLERIDFQNDNFGKKIEALITKFIHDFEENKGKFDFETNKFIPDLEKLIFTRLGIRANIDYHSALAATIPLYLNRNHIYLDPAWRGNLNINEQTNFLKRIEKGEFSPKGTVNLKEAKVGGIFSEVPVIVYMDFVSLHKTYKLTAGEMTAVLLHELGHDFNACYYADRTDRTNQVMADIARVIINKEHKKPDLEYIYREVKKINKDVKKEEIDTMVNGPRTIAGLVWFRTIVKGIFSQFKVDKYNDTAFEEGSDSFAVRFGYGKEIVLGLDKISQGTPEKSVFVLVLAHLLSLRAIIIMALAVYLLITAGSAIIILRAAATLIGSLVNLYFESDAGKNYTYDELKQRYLRARRDMVATLKNAKRMNKDEVNKLIQDIYTVDDIIKDTREVSTLSRVLGNLIFRSSSGVVDTRDSQRLMETLANNDLFISAAEFDTLSKEKA